MSSNPKGIIQAILTNDKLNEEEKSELIAEFIKEINEEYPELKYHATKSDIKETELKLTKEIENTRKEIKELDLKLTKEIKEADAKLTKEIENTKKEIKEAKFIVLKWQFIFWITQIGAIIAIFYKLVK